MGKKLNQDAEANLREVSWIALQLWKQAGRPPGRYLEFWRDAEQRVAARIAQSRSLNHFNDAAPAERRNRTRRWSVLASDAIDRWKNRSDF